MPYGVVLVRVRVRAQQDNFELELIQSHMAQKPVLRGEVGCACVAREVSVERGGHVSAPVMWKLGCCVRTNFRYRGGGVGLVDSTREEHKARAVAGIFVHEFRKGGFSRVRR